MERKKFKLIIILLFFFTVGVKANYKTEVYNCYIVNNMPKWKAVIDIMNSVSNKSNEFRLELANYQYGYIAWCIGNDKKDIAETYLENAEKNIEYLESVKFNLSMVYSYKSAFYGFRMGISNWKAPVLGPKSVDYAEKAMKADPNNPYGYIQYANAQYYMPEIFGGSKSLALDYYKKAKVIMEKNLSSIVQNWNYLSLLTSISQAFVDLNYLQSAKLYYEIILQKEPNFQWVKNELYPQLLTKIKA